VDTELDTVTLPLVLDTMASLLALDTVTFPLALDTVTSPRVAQLANVEILESTDADTTLDDVVNKKKMLLEMKHDVDIGT
jgi:hypothetical protein